MCAISCFIIILTQFVPLFSLFLCHFPFSFVIKKRLSGRISSIFPRLRRPFHVAKGNYWDRSAWYSGRSTCVVLVNLFSRIKGKRKDVDPDGRCSRMKPRSISKLFRIVSTRSNEILRNLNQFSCGETRLNWRSVTLCNIV